MFERMVQGEEGGGRCVCMHTSGSQPPCCRRRFALWSAWVSFSVLRSGGVDEFMIRPPYSRNIVKHIIMMKIGIRTWRVRWYSGGFGVEGGGGERGREGGREGRVLEGEQQLRWARRTERGDEGCDEARR
jgi:hypothetical protein